VDDEVCIDGNSNDILCCCCRTRKRQNSHDDDDDDDGKTGAVDVKNNENKWGSPASHSWYYYPLHF
jgi:hypothetical protein